MVPGLSPMSSANRPRPVSSALSSARSTARPTRRGVVLGESGGLGMRSTVQGLIQEMIAGNGSGDRPGNDGPLLRPARHTRSLTRIGRLVFLYVGPASSSSTRHRSSSESRFASTQPADPAPTTMKSYRCGSATILPPLCERPKHGSVVLVFVAGCPLPAQKPRPSSASRAAPRRRRLRVAAESLPCAGRIDRRRYARPRQTAVIPPSMTSES